MQAVWTNSCRKSKSAAHTIQAKHRKTFLPRGRIPNHWLGWWNFVLNLHSLNSSNISQLAEQTNPIHRRRPAPCWGLVFVRCRKQVGDSWETRSKQLGDNWEQVEVGGNWEIAGKPGKCRAQSTKHVRYLRTTIAFSYMEKDKASSSWPFNCLSSKLICHITIYYIHMLCDAKHLVRLLPSSCKYHPPFWIPRVLCQSCFPMNVQVLANWMETWNQRLDIDSPSLQDPMVQMQSQLSPYPIWDLTMKFSTILLRCYNMVGV